MKNTKKLSSLAAAMGSACLFLFGTHGQAQVTLQLINPSATPIMAGSTFSLDAVVSGLTAPGLDAFDLTLAALPSGITLVSASSPLSDFTVGTSANFPGGSPQIDGIANSTPDDLTGTATIAEFEFSVSSSETSGVKTINFAPEGANTQDLQDASGDQIAFVQSGFHQTVGAPEPGSLSLLLVGVASGCALIFRFKPAQR